MNDLSQALTVLSAMITPAVLILATGSLILTTSQRLGRAMERTRKIYEQFENLEEVTPQGEKAKKKYALLDAQLRAFIRRAQLLQYTMSLLFITLGIFVSTSIAIGLIALIGLKYSWIPSVLGMLGTGILFYSSIILIIESRIAIRAVKHEMGYALDLGDAVKKRL